MSHGHPVIGYTVQVRVAGNEFNNVRLSAEEAVACLCSMMDKGGFDEVVIFSCYRSRRGKGKRSPAFSTSGGFDGWTKNDELRPLILQASARFGEDGRR